MTGDEAGDGPDSRVRVEPIPEAAVPHDHPIFRTDAGNYAAQTATRPGWLGGQTERHDGQQLLQRAIGRVGRRADPAPSGEHSEVEVALPLVRADEEVAPACLFGQGAQSALVLGPTG